MLKDLHKLEMDLNIIKKGRLRTLQQRLTQL